MKKRIILVGKGGSGKDYLRKILEKEGYKYCVSYTTRPPRKEEVDGLDYFFVSEKHFDEESDFDNYFYEWNIFNGWFYGTSIQQFQDSELFIMTPTGVLKIKKEDREKSIVIYLDVPELDKKKRLESRLDADSTERRIIADQKDFLNFNDYDFSITNPNFTLQEIKKLIN